jgi:hypothetical protein
MRDFRDAKVMAQTLREVLNAKSVSITHSEALELIAKILGCRATGRLPHRPNRRPATTRLASLRARRLRSMRQFSTTMSASISSRTARFSR